ncbi:hypothetical protein S7711_02717 [Stachybotrys chartarum IBT 7711]|uniref:SnoaL-like domain-containing protein n=1 Tax=Stachybotrys chartarum (strain CBS 109288 / IBT 7711) TaxID=1280523 RepID=A0A084AZ34_STACB|nr:hypothetical protein S7711_02717 [Stachybotrys chartarum IBT 7711]KFA54389.1 hypothetical protein S40293_04302 [Stachybotrys chartarum IBT 40293]KFA74368.1 hypothetical protein S40288_06672 [Stachybotrys chartarum IBT 40288]
MAAFKLTKAHILESFLPLRHIADPALRDPFFSTTVSPSVVWTITGSAHSLAGTRTSLQAHADASFNRLGALLRAPICFTVTRVLLDEDVLEDGSVWACVETKGEAVRKNGKRYDNEYLWLTRWDAQGKIVEIRSYFDTMLSEQVLQEGDVEAQKESN